MNAVDMTDDLAQKIKQHRLGKKLSQQEASHILGVTLRTYQNWEAGQVIPWFKHRRAIDEFLAS